jgi:TPR repeat protein
MLEHGDGGGDCDVAAAVSQYKAASLQGHAPAKYHLACIYVSASQASSPSSSSLLTSSALSALTFSPSSSSSSSSLLGLPAPSSASNYDQQQKMPEFLTIAHELFNSAAESGFVPAQVMVVSMLLMLLLMSVSGCPWKPIDGGQRLRPKC